MKTESIITRPKEVLQAFMDSQFSDSRIDVLVSLLKQGESNAISRDALAALMGMSDRKVREVIEMARNEGVFVLNRQNGRGYYLPESLDDIYRQYKQDSSRAMAILRRRKHMRKILKEAGLKV